MKRDYARLEVIERNEQTIYLLGTAHVSKESVEEVKALVAEVEPEAIAVELCPTRYEALTAADKWKNLDIFKVIREGKLLMLLGNLGLSAYQRRIGKELGVEPGAELIAGVDAAKERQLEPVLIDRDIQTTLKRTWRNVGFFKKLMLLSETLAGAFEGGSDEVDAASVEALKEKENLEDAMGEFAKALPEVKGPLIDERDLYMVSKLQELDAKTVVAVVGAGHVAGMTEHFEDEIDRESLTVIPLPRRGPRSSSGWYPRSFSWLSATESITPRAAPSKKCSWLGSFQTASQRLLWQPSQAQSHSQ